MAIQTSTINGGPIAGFRNLIINGNPVINQRNYVSGAATAGAGEYTLDRWKVVTSGQSLSWSDAAGIRTAVAPAGGVEQVIEGNNIIGGTYVLNWEGTATATVNGVSVAKGGTFTLTGGTNATVRLTSGTFTKVQVEKGNSPSEFEMRPLGVETQLCYRYFFNQTGGLLVASTFFSGAGNYANATMSCKFPVPMRTSPTVSWSGNGVFSATYTCNTLAPGGTIDDGNPTSGTPSLTVASPVGMTRGYVPYWTSGAGATFKRGEIYTTFSQRVMSFDAEL